MSYREEYVDWLRCENQALYDALAKQEKENEELRKKIRKYERQEELFKEVETLKEKADSFDRLSEYFNECWGIFNA